MRVMDKRPKITRRRVLGAGAASLVALTVIPGGIIVGAGNAWSATAKALKPNTFATLLQMVRDIYPHDHVADKHYAGVVSSFDDAATKRRERPVTTRRTPIDAPASIKDGVVESKSSTSHRNAVRNAG